MKETFHTAFSRLLVQNLKKFCDGRILDRENCIKIYQTIYETVIQILKGSEIQVSNEVVNYLAQMYYDCTVINGNQELDPNIFDKLAKLENINNKDLLILATMLRGSDFLSPVVKALKSRN